MFLYIIELEVDNATNGSPMANQVLGIQKMGDLFEVDFFVKMAFYLVLFNTEVNKLIYFIT
jgi:uncharacterized protein YlaN (UPF0358 family)